MPQQHAAFMHFLGGTEVGGAALRGGCVLGVDPGGRAAELRIVAPVLDGRTRHGGIGKPGLQALKSRVERHQAVKRRGAGARNPGDDHRADDIVVREARIFAHGPVGMGAAAQGAHDPAPCRAPAFGMEARVVVHCMEVGVKAGEIVARAKIIAVDFGGDQSVQPVAGVAEGAGGIVAQVHDGMPSHQWRRGAADAAACSCLRPGWFGRAIRWSMLS